MVISPTVSEQPASTYSSQTVFPDITDNKPKRVMIVAGEASGDAYGGALVQSVHRRDSSVSFFGIGGKSMAESGVTILHDCSELAVVGIVEVVKHFRVISAAFKELAHHLRTNPPDLLVLIDYPGFNLRLAAVAKRAGVKVLYYISPQIWAWKKGRIKKIKQIVDHMAVILPFEAQYYEKEQIPVSFVGHPLLDMVQMTLSPDEAARHLGVDPQHTIIGLFPGGRRSEVTRMLPVLVAAAKRIRQHIPDAQFILPIASTLTEEDMLPHLGSFAGEVLMTHGNIHTVMRACDAIASVSGTVTLEVALVGTPQVIVYRLSPITYYLARLLVDVPFIGLCNIVAGEQVAKELIQDQASPEAIAEEILRLVRDEAYRTSITQKLSGIPEKLGAPGAHERLAEQLLSMVYS